MKKLLFVLLTSLASCSRQVDTTQQQIQQSTEPTAQINSTVKVYAGSTPSLKITYTLKNIANVQTIKLNNTFSIPVKEGQAFTYDPAAGFTNNRFYFWVFTLKDGKEIFTNPKQYWY
jgi:hypothetical protein